MGIRQAGALFVDDTHRNVEVARLLGITRRPPLVGLEALPSAEAHHHEAFRVLAGPNVQGPMRRREYLQFPPFGRDHLDNSLQHLSDLVGQCLAALMSGTPRIGR